MYLILISIFCLVVFSAYFVVSIRSASSIDAASDYFISPDKLGSKGVFATLYAAEMSIATVFIAFFQLAPFLGYILVASIFTFVIGQSMLWWLIPRIRKAAPGAATMASFAGGFYRSLLFKKVVSGITILGFVGLFVTEIVVGANLISAVINRDNVYLVSVIGIFSFVMFYTLFGGFRNVVATDKVQVVLILIGVAALVVMAIQMGSPAPGEPLIDPKTPRLENLGLTILASFAVINILYPMVDMAAWQRISAAKDTESARKGFFVGILLFIFTWGAIFFAALSLSEYSSKDAVGGIAYNFSIWASMGIPQTIAAAVGVSALMAALLSAGDVFLIVAAQSLALDFNSDKLDNAAALEKFNINKARNSVVIASVFAAILASIVIYVGFKVADLVFVVYGSTVAILPAILFAIFNGKSESRMHRWPAILSSLVGVFLGWVYGIVAISGSADSVITKIIQSINFISGPISAYNSPIIAIVFSVIVFFTTSIVFQRIEKFKK